MSTRPYNFAPGPAMLPDPVLRQMQSDLLNWRDTGSSLFELGPRLPMMQDYFAEVEKKCRSTLSVPEDYKILFLHGGGQGQFAAVPMNLLGPLKRADYITTGYWSERAYQEAQRYGDIHLAATEDKDSLITLPLSSQWNIRDQLNYLYYCHNETLYGVQFSEIPQIDSAPLVSDMTSCLGAQLIDISRFGLIFAATQKNLGIAGISVVIIREDLLDQALGCTPAIWNYRLQHENYSCVNTPSAYAIYALDLMLTWIEAQGGVATLEVINRRKAAKIYAAIDQSKIYFNVVDPTCRSFLNVSFNLPTESLTQTFLNEARSRGLYYLKGHKAVGGVRASLYNAMPEAGVDCLIEFMRYFEEKLSDV